VKVSRTLHSQTIRRVAIAAATYVIQGVQLDAGDELTIQTIGYTNETSNNKDMTWGFRIGSRDVWVHTIQGAGNGLFHSWVGPVTIPSQCRLLFKVLSPAAGNKTTINVVGYIETVCPETDPAT